MTIRQSLPGNSVSERVRLRRMELGYTQAQLAERAGLVRSEIEYIEAGKRGDGHGMRVGTAIRLARVLVVTLDALFAPNTEAPEAPSANEDEG